MATFEQMEQFDDSSTSSSSSSEEENGEDKEDVRAAATLWKVDNQNSILPEDQKDEDNDDEDDDDDEEEVGPSAETIVPPPKKPCRIKLSLRRAAPTTGDNDNTTSASMAEKVIPMCTFSIPSGALCFGSPDNVIHGAKREIQIPSLVEMQLPPPEGGGTVSVAPYEYNFAALTGTWMAYALVRNNNDGSNSTTVAWFVCHESLSNDPYAEAKRILEVANRSGEKDNATFQNTKQTWEGRVLVINRYDWGTGEAQVSLVDYDQAKSAHANEWYQNNKGLKMILEGEYAYGRFGLVSDKKKVHSLLFFTADTPLTETTFVGDNRPIYVPLTPEQRHAKRLADGSYTGFQFLRAAIRPGPPPSVDDLLGPFNKQIISMEELERVQREACPQTPMEPDLRVDILQLVNELMCQWVVALASMAENCTSRNALDEQAFPQRQITSVDSYLVKCMNDEGDSSSSADGIRLDETECLSLVGRRDHNLWSLYSIQQVARGIRYLVGEVLELSGKNVDTNERQVLVPLDVRQSIYYDRQLYDKFRRTKFFYPNDMWSDS